MRRIKFLVDILHLIVLSCKLTHRSRARSILQVLSFAIAILENFLAVTQFAIFFAVFFCKSHKIFKSWGNKNI